MGAVESLLDELAELREETHFCQSESAVFPKSIN